MASDQTSIRISRLNRLMRYFLSNQEVPRLALLEYMNYSSVRTLQRDLSYLRTQNSVIISYDFSKQTYKCSDPGNFVLRFKLCAGEVVMLVTGIDLTKRFFPENASAVRSLWNKMRIFVPHCEGQSLGCVWPEPAALLSRDLAERYKKIVKVSEKLSQERGE